MTLDKIIELVIAWGPTILFLLIVIIATISGLVKGVRKEAISIVHTVICFTACLIIFLLLVENKSFDAKLLEAVNKFLGDRGSLQSLLGVSEDCKTIREVLVLYIPTTMSFNEGLALVLKDNGAYLYTLVDMAYRVAFAIILYVFFLILKLVCYIIYLIFYSERKHQRRVERDFTNGLIDNGYNKHKGFGALIGASRGLVFGLVTMSFIGTIFFIAAGGDGTKRQEDIDYGDDTLNLVSDAYSSITEYGTTGIFKVFNMLKDKDDVPYYLFAADLIFSGGLKDENLGVNQNIIFRDELAAYVHFARETYTLMLKYGGDELKELIKTQGTSIDPMEVLVNIMGNEEFQAEFDHFIVEFDSKTYFINLSLSLVDSIASNIDELNIATPEASDVIKICFKKGYLSEAIPDEAKLLEERNNDALAESHPEKYELDYIRPSYLINADDFKLVLRGFFDFINRTKEDITNEEKLTLDLTSTIIDRVKYLSIFDTDKKGDLNPVVKRLYKFIDVTYLENPATYSGLEAIDDSRLDNIDWMGELLTLVDLVKLGIDSFAYDFINLKPTDDYFRIFLNEFKSTTEGYEQNLHAFSKITDYVADSMILGEVLSSSLIYNEIYTALEGAVGGELILRRDINYSNSYDDSGNICEYGELYYLAHSLNIIFKNDEFINEVESLIYDLKTDEEMEDSIIYLVEMLNANTPDGTIVDNLGSSSIGQSLLSSLIYSDTFNVDISSYIDQSLLELDSDNNPINLIKKDEIKGVLKLIPDVLPIVNEFMDKMEITVDDVLTLLEDDRVSVLFDSKLLESIVSGVALDNLANIDMVIVPMHAKLISDSEGVSELRCIYDIVTLDIIDLNEILNNDDPSIYLDMLLNLSDSDIDTILESKVIYYTINESIKSVDLGQGLTIVVPNTSVEKLTGEVISSVITKDELKKAFNVLPALLPTDINNLDTNELVYNVVMNKDGIIDSDVLCATIALFIANGLDVDVFDIPKDLKDAAEKTVLETEFENSPWPHELNSFVSSLDEILEISNGGEFDLTNPELMQKQITAQISKLNKESSSDSSKTKLDLLYESSIITNVLTSQVDNAVSGLFEESDLEDLKENNLYKKEEFSTLVEMFSIFDINLDSINDSTYLIEQITNNIDVLNDSYKGTSETNLDYLYHGNLLGVLLNRVLTESSVIVPEDARVSGSNVIKKSEAKAMVSLVNVFGSLTTLSLDHVDLNSLDESSLSKSLLFSANIYSELNKIDTIAIPKKAVNDNEYIKDTELNTFIRILKNPSVTSLLFNQNLDDTFDLTAVKNVELSSLTPEIMRTLAGSNILEATCINILGTSGLDLSSLPKNYRDDLNKESLSNDIDNAWLKNQELTKLIDALDSVFYTSDINSLNDFTNIDAIIDYIDNGALKDYFGTSSIELAYKSIIVSSNISSMLDKVLTADIIDTNVLDNKRVIKYPNTNLYQVEEIKNLLASFKELGINVSAINKDPNNINIDGIFTADFNKVCASYLVSAILDKQIDNALREMVHSNALDSNDSKETLSGIRRYKPSELEAFIKTLQYPFGITSFTNIDDFNYDAIFNPSTIDTIYSNGSYVIRYIIAKSLDDNLTSDYIDRRLLASKMVKSEDLRYYKQEELHGLIDMLTNLLGVHSMNDFTNISASFDLGSLTKESYDSSVIARGVLTKQVDTLFNTIGFKTNVNAYDKLDGANLLKWKEVEAIKGIIGSDKNYDISTLRIDELKNILITNNTYNSYLLAQTLSDSIKGAGLIITRDDYADGLIKPAATSALLDCLIAIDPDMTLNVKISEFRICDAEAIYKSNIINATIFNNLTLDGYSNIYMYKENVETTFDISGNTIYKFSESELRGLVELLGNVNINNITIDIQSLLKVDIDVLMNSSIIMVILSDYLIDYASRIPFVTITGEPKELFDIRTHEIITRNVITRAEFETILQFIR